MAGQQRKMEGNDDQRRQAAREAREQGKLPSEVGATQGASKQLKQAKNSDSHQEKMDLKGEGKASRANRTGPASKPRPGNREIDPSREESFE